MQWQGDHEDTSMSAAIMAKCLGDHGVPVPATYQEMLAAQEANNIRDEDCDGTGVYTPYAPGNETVAP